MVEAPFGSEKKGIFLVRQLGGRFVLESDEARFSTGPGEALGVEDRRAGMPGIGTGPAEPVFFDALVRDAAVAWGDGSNFLHDFGRAGEVEAVGAHSFCYFTGYEPVGPGVSDRFDSLAHTLDAAFGVGEGAILFGETGGGQYDVSERSGIAHENILHDEEVDFFEGAANVGSVGMAENGILADEIESVDFASLDGVVDLGKGQAGPGIERDAPGLFELGFDSGIVNSLVAGIDVGQRTHVASSLDVVLAAKGIDAAGGLSDVSGEHGELADGEHVIGAVGVLGYAHGEQRAGGFVGGVDARGLGYLLGRDAGDRLGIL